MEFAAPGLDEALPGPSAVLEVLRRCLRVTRGAIGSKSATSETSKLETDFYSLLDGGDVIVVPDGVLAVVDLLLATVQNGAVCLALARL